MNNNSPYIYVIEDELSISKLISLYLTKSDFRTREFYNGEDALEAIKSEKLPDLIILDLNLPGMSGFDFLTSLNKMFKVIPTVIILSARDSDEDLIKGLGYGADEFITKPFSPSVLVARVQACLRRLLSASIKAEESIKFLDYTLLLNSCVLKKGNKKISLSEKEYEVLEYLIRHAGEVVSPDKIFRDIWKVDFGDTTAVAVYIQRLRKKLEEDVTNCKCIKTEFGKGYIFNKEIIRT